MKRWQIIALISICLPLLLILIGLPVIEGMIRDRISVQVTSIQLTDFSLRQVKVDVSTILKNQNPIGFKARKIEYDLYFEDDGDWVFFGRGEGGKLNLEANEAAAFETFNDIDNWQLLKLIWDVIFSGNLELPRMKVDGSVWVKFGPWEVKNNFEEIVDDSLLIP